MTDFLAIVLAAGEGTRMRSAQPKVLHSVGGLPIVGHVVRAAKAGGATQVAVVTGPGHDEVRTAVAALLPEAHLFEQTERRGTAHAARMARELWSAATGYVAVVYGDHPLLRGENFSLVTDKLAEGFDAAILGFVPADPTGYGRLVTDGDRLLAIREHKDASAEERRIGLCNACILAFRADLFRDLIDRVGTSNAQGEFYITDLVELANAMGHKVGFGIAPEQDVMGVNDRAQLARAEAQFQEVRRADFMKAGVTLRDPSTVYFSYDTEIARDVTIEPGVWFGPGVRVEESATINAFCHIEHASIGAGVEVGPFARLRGDVDLMPQSKAGSFVEMKNTKLGPGSKVPHLSYIGDAVIGAGSNIGGGTITANYDGANKSRTTVGDNAFVGTNNSLVAPVIVGDGAYTASGSVITEDVPPDALALGRARQENKPGYAPKLRERALAKKQAKGKA